MDDKLMSPAASPSRVTRRGRRPLMIAYAVVALFCGFIGFVAYAKNQNTVQVADKTPQPRIQGESPAQIAKRLMSARRMPPPKETKPPSTTPQTPTLLIASVDESSTGPDEYAPQRGSRAPAARLPEGNAGDDTRKSRQAALRSALSGSTAVQLTGNRDKPAATSGVEGELERVRRERANLGAGSDPTAAYQQAMKAALAAAQGAGAPPMAADGPVPVSPPSGAVAMEGGMGTFNRMGSGDRFQLGTEMQRPTSRYVLQAGKGVIPAVLLSAINSELPGPITAQVATDVFDSPTGRHLLIPQGTRLFGEYSANVVFGQSRLLVAWQRLIFHDGRTLDIGEMPGADGVGRSGFSDQVDNHFFRMFASAILMSGVTAGVAMSQDVGTGSGNSQRVTAGSAMSQALGQQLGQVTAQLIQKNMNTAPTLDIRPGYRFSVVVTKDLPFDGPYRRQYR